MKKEKKLKKIDNFKLGVPLPPAWKCPKHPDEPLVVANGGGMVCTICGYTPTPV